MRVAHDGIGARHSGAIRWIAQAHTASGEFSAPATLIEVCRLSYQYEDGTPALKGVDFRLKTGETVAYSGLTVAARRHLS